MTSHGGGSGGAAEDIYVGIDWATRTHQVCIVAHDGQVIDELAVEHSATALADLCDRLTQLAKRHAATVRVAIELTTGIVIDTLLERSLEVYSINPKQADRFRDRFSMSEAKDDRRDAHVLADSLRTDRRAFRRLEPEDPQVLAIREWSRMTADLQQERNRLANRVREQVRRYYPQLLELGEVCRWILELWKMIPTPQDARQARPGRVQALLKTHRIRRLDAKSVLDILRQPAMTVAPGAAEAAQAHITLLRERLIVVLDQLKQCQQHLNALLDELATPGDDESEQRGGQRDVTIILSMPGVGPIVLATLLAEASRPLRGRDYHALRALSGVAPVTRRSGKRGVVMMRHGCNARLRNALYHWARVAAQRDELSKLRYAALRARGHTHGRALRSVADRLLGVLCAMLRDGTTFRAAA